MRSENGFDVEGWNGETTLWERVAEMSDLEVLKLAEHYGFWSSEWETSDGRQVIPNLEDLRGAIYDAWSND